MSQNMNQFRQQAEVGMLDLVTNPNPSVYTVKYDPDATSTLRIVNGEGALLKDGGAGDGGGRVPLVDKRAADTDAIFGVKIFNTMQNQSPPGGEFTVAAEGTVIYMKADGALARGVQVSLVQATPGQVQAVGTDKLFGLTLDKALAANDLIRIKIQAVGI